VPSRRIEVQRLIFEELSCDCGKNALPFAFHIW
jgi:hypothetical protein